MIDISGIEYNFWPSIFWVAGIISVGVLLGILDEIYDNLFLSVMGSILVVGGVFIGGLVGIWLQADIYVQGEEKRIATEQLIKQGYDNIDLSTVRNGETFTSSVDGAYFRGVLVSEGEYTFKIVEVTDANS